jgi:peptide/nickel transport system permease protein
MTITTALQPRRPARPRRPDVATQWQLIWRRFRRHRLALVGVAIIGLLVFTSLFAEILAPYGPLQRDPLYVNGPPMLVHLIDADGAVHARPFVYARTMGRDPVTLRPTPLVDEANRWPLRFFVRGQGYSFWGLFRSDIHLFGAEGGFVHLFGTDDLGRDVFSRNLYAARISLSVGFIGVAVAFVLGTVIGGIAGYFGGLIDNLTMRLIEFIRSIPTLPLWLALSAALPRDWSALQVYLSITLILALIGWTWLARTVRSKLLALREEDFATAAVLKPPKLAISQPEMSGPVHAISRGVLNTKAVAVARTRVGNSSGSQHAIQVYWPDTNTPLNAAAISTKVRSCVQRNTTGTDRNASTT